MPTETFTFVLFDKDCPLCRSLAAFVKDQFSADVTILSWQDFVKERGLDLLSLQDLQKPANELRVWNHRGLLEGEAAWTHLLVTHPGLRRLNWLARKLGLDAHLAPSLDWVGHRAKKICFRCR